MAQIISLYLHSFRDEKEGVKIVRELFILNWYHIKKAILKRRDKKNPYKHMKKNSSLTGESMKINKRMKSFTFSHGKLGNSAIILR